jgi:outer membrane murein-binding lipoprotein Lpp
MKKVLFIATIGITLLASCTETKKKKSIETQNTETTISKEELQQKKDSIEAVIKENRILDSIRQVKSHGHAH